MTIEIIHYTGEKYSIKNATALYFDGEHGMLTVQGDNEKIITYRLVKEVCVI